ncbi:MAG: hypothetical protein DK306_002389, partial [Chloroflexi bacterium]
PILRIMPGPSLPPPPGLFRPSPQAAPAPLPSSRPTPSPPLTRFELLTAGLIFTGLITVLALAAAVMVQPSLVDHFNPYWPVLAALGFGSTVGGFWWLWWRPR